MKLSEAIARLEEKHGKEVKISLHYSDGVNIGILLETVQHCMDITRQQKRMIERAREALEHGDYFSDKYTYGTVLDEKKMLSYIQEAVAALRADKLEEQPHD